jgi:predicted RNase H-like HicB family nuclease
VNPVSGIRVPPSILPAPARRSTPGGFHIIMDSAGRNSHISPMQFTVTVCHDEGEGVWYVQSSDVPGLNAEAATLEALIEVVTDLAPELVVANLPDAEFSRTHYLTGHARP